jgi:hypothetical protein
MDSSVVAALIGVGGVGLTIAGTLAGTFLGSWLNRRTTLSTALDIAEVERHKYTQDRLWDHRKDSYTAILAGLRATSKHAYTVDRGYNGGEMHPEEYHASDERTIQVRTLWDKWRETESEYESARLLLSDAFVARFEKIGDDLNAVDIDDLPPCIHSDFADIFRSAVPEMLAIAQAEIAPPLSAKVRSSQTG